LLRNLLDQREALLRNLLDQREALLRNLLDQRVMVGRVSFPLIAGPGARA
jgi:hypothetical protein